MARKEHIDAFRFTGVKELNGACISALDAFLVFTDGLIRLSVGLEDYEDLRAGLTGALDGLAR